MFCEMVQQAYSWLPASFRKQGNPCALVAELLPHKDEIDPKYAFLMKAPVEDPDGNKTVVKFSRKNKEQFVQSEIDKKPTGWKVFYRKGKWIEEALPRQSISPRVFDGGNSADLDRKQ